MITPFLTMAIALSYAYYDTETFREQFVAFNLLHSTSFNISVYELMIANMTKSDYSPFGVQNLICLIPLVVHLMCPDKLASSFYEPIANYICIAILVILMYGHILALAFQYLARNPPKRLLTIV